MKAEWIAPELATLVEDSFSHPDWIFEEKFDGVRCIAVKRGNKVTLYSRNKKVLNHTFPELAEALEKKKSKDYVIDGEIVAFEKNISRFSLLQNRLGRLDLAQIKGKKAKVYLYVFDILFWDKERLTSLPLLERKKKLKALFPFTKEICYTPHIVKNGEEFFHKACKKGWEGVIGKRANAPYLGRRTRDWVKFKCINQQEFVIGGFTEPQRSRIGFGALLVGHYEKGNLQFAGKVGTGFDTQMLKTLYAKLKKLEQTKCPFAHDPEEANVHFVRPHLVCEIGFTEWTNDGKLRHPRFLGLRIDKSPKQVVRERKK